MCTARKGTTETSRFQTKQIIYSWKEHLSHHLYKQRSISTVQVMWQSITLPPAELKQAAQRAEKQKKNVSQFCRAVKTELPASLTGSVGQPTEKLRQGKKSE